MLMRLIETFKLDQIGVFKMESGTCGLNSFASKNKIRF